MMASAHSGHVLTPLAQGAQHACPQLRSVRDTWQAALRTSAAHLEVCEQIRRVGSGHAQPDENCETSSVVIHKLRTMPCSQLAADQSVVGWGRSWVLR
jgi:hypothetical protein